MVKKFSALTFVRILTINWLSNNRQFPIIFKITQKINLSLSYLYFPSSFISLPPPWGGAGWWGIPNNEIFRALDRNRHFLPSTIEVSNALDGITIAKAALRFYAWKRCLCYKDLEKMFTKCEVNYLA